MSPQCNDKGKKNYLIEKIHSQIHIPKHTRSLSGSLLGYKTIP